MRVLLPWKKTSSNDLEQQDDETCQPASNPDESKGGDADEDVARASSSASPSGRRKRSRREAEKELASTVSNKLTCQDEKQPATVPTDTSCDANMTAGGRPRGDSDGSNGPDGNHRGYYDRHPENEPHDSYGPSPVVVVNHNKECYKSSEDDDGSVALESQFSQDLKRRGLEIVEQDGDGNCLFRAVSLQVYGDASSHAEVRRQCMDFMSSDPEHFGCFVEENFQDYISRKRQDGVHGNNPELQALSELFNRPVEVFTPQAGADRPMNIFHAEYKTSDQPIRLSYHDGNHYNAVVDPIVPTAGLGLGMPGLQPGLADKLQVAAAVKENDQIADLQHLQRVVKESQDDELQRMMKESEDDSIQRAIKESSFAMTHVHENKVLALSDVDATNYELEQAVLAQSMETYRRQEHGKKKRASDRMPQKTQNDCESFPAASFGVASGSVPPAASMPAVGVASIPAVASAASAAVSTSVPLSPYEYPPSVQELVMNGFELAKVVHAYELVGDNFDELLAFLTMNSSA